MNEYEDWIIRFYASHRIIPKGHKDGEIIGNLIRCKDCEYAVEEYNDGECYCDNKVNGMIYIGEDWNHFCSWAKRREE